MEAAAKIVALCREIDETARDIYAALGRVSGQPDLAEFWIKMSAEEAQHVQFWKRAEESGVLETMPEPFDEAGGVAGELERSLSRSRDMLGNVGPSTTVAQAFTVAYRMEFYLLHPAFEVLFKLMGPTAGDPNPGDEYESHITHFIEMLALHGAATPELELLGETIHKLWAENKRLATQSTHDDLTGLLNRRGFFNLSAQLAHLAARTGSLVGVMMIDIDRFKAVNDEHGHIVGDTALKGTARCLSERLRASDIAGRYGGEEFVILAPAVTPGGTAILAETIRASIQDSHPAGIPLTVSIGVAESELAGTIQEDLFELIRRADAALYLAKENGRNQVHVYAEEESS